MTQANESSSSGAVRQRLLIWGGGGHGKVVADIARACGHDVVGFIDGDSAKVGQIVEPGGARVIDLDTNVISRFHDPEGQGVTFDAVVVAVGDNATRLSHAIALGRWNSDPLVHPRAWCSPFALIAAGTVVGALAVINADARVGRAVIINSGAIVEHDCTIGHGTHISPGAVIAGGVSIGDRTWIGASAAVIQGIRIGADVVVGAGAVVIRDVPDGDKVAGVPARSMGRSK